MATLKQIAKNVAGEVLLRTGLWRRHLERMARRGEAIVLTYHRVIEKWDRTLDYSQPGMVVTADTFDRQLWFLKKYFEIVPLSFLVDRHNNLGSHPATFRPLCAITFDDGWRDNYDVAFPILRQHGVTATIFLTTDFIGTNRTFWHTELMSLLLHADVTRYGLLEYSLHAYPPSIGHHWRQLVGSRGILNAHKLDPLIEAVKETCDEDEITILIRDLKHAVGTSDSLLSDRRFFLEWDQVCQMAGAGMEMGSHGCSHRSLTQLNVEEAEKEVVRSKLEIEQRLNRQIGHFAFPYGAWNPVLLNLVNRAGYKSCCIGSRRNHGQSVSHVFVRSGAHEGISGGGPNNFTERIFAVRILTFPKVFTC